MPYLPGQSEDLDKEQKRQGVVFILLLRRPSIRLRLLMRLGSSITWRITIDGAKLTNFDQLEETSCVSPVILTPTP